MSLKRWFKEKWTRPNGEPCGTSPDTNKPQKCRPSKKVSSKTPKTWSEMGKKGKKKAAKEKQEANREGKQFSSHETGKTWNAEKSLEKGDKPFSGYNKKKHSKTGGLNDSYRKKVNRETGSNLQRPVTGDAKPGSKAAKRRKSFCARMSGVKGATSKDGKLTPKGAALKRWKCSKSLVKSMCDYRAGKLKKSLQKTDNANDGSGMAHQHLIECMRAIAKIKELLPIDKNLEDWADDKITLAADYLMSVAGYLEGEKREGKL